jgi:regulator of sirC expression with transglutaminase-like and TPR domain
MSERLSLTLFAHVCSRPEAELDLAEAALLIAEGCQDGGLPREADLRSTSRSAPHTPGSPVDVARYVRALDELGEGARAKAAHASSDEARLERAIRYVYGDAGFHGNEDDYYDPRNSFLNEVIDRRTGIPITLAVVLVEVCRRAGVDARGVSFPGHFLVRSDTPRGTIVVDPFSGRPLSRDDLRALYARSTGQDGDPPAQLLEPATKVQILTRILNNLRGIYENRGDDLHLRGVLERVQVLVPSDSVRAKVQELGGSTPWRSRGGGLN